MKIYKTIVSISLISLSGCTAFLGEPSTRVSQFSDVELCTELADKTFKYHAEWSWAISDEIKKRNLVKSERCSAVYNARVARLTAKIQATPISFSEALSRKD